MKRALVKTNIDRILTISLLSLLLIILFIKYLTLPIIYYGPPPNEKGSILPEAAYTEEPIK